MTRYEVRLSRKYINHIHVCKVYILYVHIHVYNIPSYMYLVTVYKMCEVEAGMCSISCTWMCDMN